MRRSWIVSMLVIAVVTAAACSEEEPTDFSADTRNGFMAACTSPLEDDRFVADLCQCVFDRTQSDIAFGEFSSIDDALVTDPTGALPVEIVDIVASCVIEVGEL